MAAFLDGDALVFRAIYIGVATGDETDMAFRL
jgi:hypothetical protein